MKTIHLLAILALAATLPGLALAQTPPDPPTRNLSFVWDEMPAAGFVIRTIENGGEWQDVGEAATNEFTGDFPAGEFRVSVVAFAEVRTESGGDGGRIFGERSEWLAVPPSPGKPGPPRMKIKISFQGTIDVGE